MQSRWHLGLLWLFVSLQLANIIPTQNEEMYFALSRQFMDPAWMSWSFSFNEFAGTRLLFQYMTGHLLSLTTFEWFAFISRLISYALLLWPINSIFNKLNIGLGGKLVILELFIVFGQTYFAGGWIFQGFEAKTFSYIFVLFSLERILSGKTITAMVLAAVATWFHILVGGWYTLGLGLFLILNRQKPLRIAGLAALWLLIVGPFIYYLFKTVLIDSRTVINGVNLDTVYVFFRNPHHTGIFKPWADFSKLHLTGIVMLAISFMAGLMLRTKASQLLTVIKLLFLSFAGLTLVNLAVGAFDQTGSFLKFYPFRTAVLSLFLFLTLLTAWLKHQMFEVYFRRLLLITALLVVAPYFFKLTSANAYKFREGTITQAQQSLYHDCMDVSSEGDMFLFYDHLKWDLDISFSRKTMRERFFVFKFVPSGGEKLYDWYERYLYKERLKSNPEVLIELKDQYGLKYLISSNPLDLEFLKLEKKGESHYIYSLND